MFEFLSDYAWIFQRMGAAFLIGLIVGWEREIRNKPAGLRTMMLICMGACVFTMVSDVVTGNNVDRTRIAAQIATGVGFIGAGSIMRSRKAVYGLTTAADIWMASALGMACGFGRFDIAFIGGLAGLLVLLVFQEVAHSISHSHMARVYRLSTKNPNLSFAEIELLFREAHLRILRKKCYQEGDEYVFAFKAVGHVDRHLSFREKLLHLPDLMLRRR